MDSLPRVCADSIFPALNYQVETPVQFIFVTDVHGSTWIFRHICRGNPCRHLLTTGWTKFIKSKNLIVRDTTVFVRNQNGQIFVGFRRVARSKNKFARNKIDKVSTSVVEAAYLAANDKPFKIAFYPNARSCEFVVKAEMVESSLHMPWIETEGSSSAIPTW